MLFHVKKCNIKIDSIIKTYIIIRTHFKPLLCTRVRLTFISNKRLQSLSLSLCASLALYSSVQHSSLSILGNALLAPSPLAAAERALSDPDVQPWPCFLLLPPSCSPVEEVNFADRAGFSEGEASRKTSSAGVQKTDKKRQKPGAFW